jgi:type I restriction enzyme M protein
MEDIKEGYIIDYISGLQVKANPEEIKAVQVYSKILVEDYGYPKECIQTHPQFRVKASPSDTEFKYPVDIVVFRDGEKKRGTEYIVVECKKPTREDGIEQLKHYLSFSDAELGVWFNGNSTHYIRKYIKKGRIYFDEHAIGIPNYGQRFDDIGLFKRKDLIPTHNLKAKFISIRNYLAGNAVGTTRDEELARQIINILLCKLYDEKFTRPDDIVTFRAGVNESPKAIKKRIQERFKEAINRFSDVLSSSDSITLDDRSLAYVVGEIQYYSLLETERDVIGDAFEVFIHRALKGGNGQYFTPKNVVKTAIKIINPGKDDTVIDPACGSGGFLIEGLKHLHSKIEEEGRIYNWPEDQIVEEKISKANLNFCGIEKDDFLSKITKAYMVLMKDGRSGIFCEDSLEIPKNWQQKTRNRIHLGSFDVLLANPPFGSKIKVKGEAKLSQFPLGHKWKYNRTLKKWEKSEKLLDGVPPQILFLDRCLDLVKEGGRLAIVLPDGVLSNPSDGYIVQNILSKAEIIGLIDLPMSTFLPYTPTKTHILFLKRTDDPRLEYDFFMSYAKTCGHDKRGRAIKSDEVLEIPAYLEKLFNGEITEHSHLGWMINTKNIVNNILLPKYYNPDIDNDLNQYIQSGDYEVKSIGELEKAKILKVSRGNEVGSEFYGTGDVPFVRTSEISNWEITSDCTHCVSEGVYSYYKDRQKLEVEDILVVNDGTYLMGRAAMITEADLKIVIQSHFRRIKILKKDVLSPYLLLPLLGMEIVQRQIESKSFRQGTISTLGNRLLEVKIPIPTNDNLKRAIIEDTRKIIEDKSAAKLKAQSYVIMSRTENLMGIKNKAKIGNL